MRRRGPHLHLAAWLVVLVACSAEAPLDLAPPAPIEAAGDWMRFKLNTHCGLDRSVIKFDGDYWEVTGPGPLNDGSGNPPAGFENPSDDGWIVRIDADDAGYESSAGVPLFLRRLDDPPQPNTCL